MQRVDVREQTLNAVGECSVSACNLGTPDDALLGNQFTIFSIRIG